MIAFANFTRRISARSQVRIDYAYVWLSVRDRTHDEKVAFLAKQESWSLADVELCARVLAGDRSLVSEAVLWHVANGSLLGFFTPPK